MSVLRRTRFQQKLMQFAMSCTVLALAVVVLGLTGTDWLLLRRLTHSHLDALSRVAAEAAPAIWSQNNEAAADRLATALLTDPAVVAVALYTPDGHLLIDRRHPDTLLPPSPSSPPAAGTHQAGRHSHWVRAVPHPAGAGTLVVTSDLFAKPQRLHQWLATLVAVSLAGALLALWLARRLRRHLAAPVQSLMATAARVRATGDYGLRAEGAGDDEFGLLTEAFNAMLQRVQQNEAALHHAAERLRLALEAANLGTWDWDIGHGTIRWNPRNYELHGLTPDQPVDRRRMSALIHPDDVSSFQRGLDDLLQGRRLLLELRLVLPDGRTRLVSYRGQALAAPDGRVARAVGVTIDITQRRAVEQRVAESERRFRLVAERAPALIWSCDAALRRHYMNQTWSTFTGRDALEDAGDGWRQLVPAEDLQHWLQVVDAARAQGDPYSLEYRLRRHDGGLRWMAETGSPRFDADGSFTGYLASCVDITTRKENEAELEAHVLLRTRQLEAANRDLESFSYSVSHDLRNPLQIIQGCAQLAQVDFEAGDSTELGENLRNIVHAANRMNQLIEGFIVLARISRAELAVGPVDLTALAAEVFDLLRRAEPTREIEIGLAPDLQCVGDARLLRIIVDNLIRNAWKFSAPRRPARIEMGALCRDGTRIFFVRDNGIGFDPAAAPRLFHAFKRLANASSFAGAGVGLSTVARCVQRHGGRVWVDAKPEQGATFYFTLDQAAAFAVGGGRDGVNLVATATALGTGER